MSLPRPTIKPTKANRERRHEAQASIWAPPASSGIDATHRGFTNVNADLDQALRLLQGLTGIVDQGFKTAFDQTTELRVEMQQEFAALNAKVDQVLAALRGRPRP